nr:integrase, catalytic region, zinc finger, CCHC-type, peptidase aspartic, catalytic [Tanacetum cinerariifolium]
STDFGPIFDDEPLQKVSNDGVIYQDAQNVSIDSLDMSYDREEIDQNDDHNDLVKERELLASLFGKLKCEIDESKNRNKILESSNNFLKEANNRLLNAKTLNVKYVSALCDKCVLHDKHDMCVLKSVAKPLNEPVASESNKKPRNYTRKLYERVSKTCTWWYPKFTPSGYIWKPKSGKENVNPNLIKIVLFIVDSGCSKHMTGNLKLLINFVEKFLGMVKFGNDQIAPILRYGDLVQGVVTIKRVYYVEGLNYNLFSVGQFCDADLEVAFRKSTSFIRDLNGNDLLSVKVLYNIVYKTGQSVQTMNMLNNKCRTSFAKPEYLKKAKQVNPRLYDIGCYNDNLALLLSSESDEVIRLEKESRSKLSDLVRPFDYAKLNSLYDLFVPQREKSSEQRFFSELSRISHINAQKEQKKESFQKRTIFLETRMNESISGNKNCQSIFEIDNIQRDINTIITGVELCKQKIASPTWYGHIEPVVKNTIEQNFDPVISKINVGLHMFLKRLNEEMVADLRYFNSFESEVDSLTSQLETQKTQFVNEIDRLSREYFYADHMNAILAVPLDGLHVDEKLHFVEEPMEIIDRKVKRLKRSRIPLVKVRWNSKRGPEFT